MATFSYTTIQNQTWYDISTQLFGTPDQALNLAISNNYSILNDPIAFSEIEYTAELTQLTPNPFNNKNNTIISTAPNAIIYVNSFDNSFDLNAFF
jgi:hypothetical protein